MYSYRLLGDMCSLRVLLSNIVAISLPTVNYDGCHGEYFDNRPPTEHKLLSNELARRKIVTGQTEQINKQNEQFRQNRLSILRVALRLC